MLTQFYNELMEPNFPKDELDELDDWVYAFRNTADSEYENENEGSLQIGPCMDVILLVGVSLAHSVGKDKQDGAPEMTHSNTILAGVVFV